MNKTPIDIIVPWVNPKDENWKKDFNFWKEKETGIKDACRYNDWGFIKYVFRSISQNCPWCRYVFFVVSNETQIPSWLNVDCPRLKIVYHKDYIPKEFLPTFNSNVIEMFYGNIKELSENFILINDDMIFTKKTDSSFYFENDKPVYKYGIRNLNNSYWDKTIKKSAKKIGELINKKCPIFDTYHLPVSYKKSMFNFIMHKLHKEIYKSFENSKFRHDNNFMHFIVYFALNMTKQCVYKNTSRGKYYSILRQNYFNLNCVACCVNESEKSTKNSCLKALACLNNLFKNKSEFEK